MLWRYKCTVFLCWCSRPKLQTEREWANRWKVSWGNDVYCNSGGRNMMIWGKKEVWRNDRSKSDKHIAHTHQTQTRLSAQPICHNMNDEHTLTHTYHPLPQKVFRNTDMHYPICHSRSISVLRSLCIFHLFLISFPAYLVLIPGLHAGIRLTLRTALSWLDNQVLILYVKWAHQHAFNS